MTTFELPKIDRKKIGQAIVLGAGPTGLSTAWRLAKHGWKVSIIEKTAELGGHGASKMINGYKVDDGPHKLYPQVPCALPLIKHFVGDNLVKISKTSSIFLRGKYIPFPFGMGDLFKGLGIRTGVRCGLSFAIGKFEQLLRGGIEKNYTDFVVARYGRYAHHLVFEQIATKLWGIPDQLDVQLAKIRIIAPNLFELLSGLLFGTKNKPKLNADCFYYPRGGLDRLWDNMGKEIEQLGGTIIRQSLPKKIFRRNDHNWNVTYTNFSGQTETLSSEILISTIPIKTTFAIFDPHPEKAVIENINSLKLSSLLVMYVVVNVPRLLSSNWIFFPESQYHFARISEQKGFSMEMVPNDRTVLMVEVPLARKEIMNKERNKLIEETIEQLRDNNLIKSHHEILEIFSAYDDSIYPIYSLGFRKKLDNVLAYSDTLPNFYLNGRLGLFCYNNMDHSMEMGLTLADHIAADGNLFDWQRKRQTFYEYKIVD